MTRSADRFQGRDASSPMLLGLRVVMLGYKSPGKGQDQAIGAVERADELFHTERQPWSPELF